MQGLGCSMQGEKGFEGSSPPPWEKGVASSAQGSGAPGLGLLVLIEVRRLKGL